MDEMQITIHVNKPQVYSSCSNTAAAHETMLSQRVYFEVHIHQHM